MADKLYFSRDAKLYVELTSNAGEFQGLWEVPVLDGFSFSQSTNQTEIGLTEMESTAGISRRGRRLFTDSLAPAEWSFSTYIRPTKKNTSEHHLVDEVLWAAMAGADIHAGTGGSEFGDFSRNSTDKVTSNGTVLDVTGGSLPSGGTGGLLSFDESNRSTLPKLTLYFVFETDTTNPMVYKLSNAIVNECSIDFDIDGIATANWSGFAKEVNDLQSEGKVNAGATAPLLSTYDVWLDSGNDFVMNLDVDAGSINITGVSNAADASITTATPHGLSVGDSVVIAGVVGDSTGDDDLETTINATHTVKAVTSTTVFTVEADTSANDAYASGGTINAAANWRTAYNTGVTSTTNFIRNRLTQLEVRGQNPDVMEGKRIKISNITTAGPGVATTAAAHGLKVGDKIKISGVAGLANASSWNTTLFVVSVPSTTSFTASATATGAALAGTGTYTANSGVVDTGIYSFTLTGGNVTISNNVTYLVPEELGTINKPIEGVTGSRAVGGNFTCYLVFDNDSTVNGNTGSSSDFFADLVAPTKGLTKVVNDFNVTFKVGGVVAGEPRIHLNFPQVHIDVPSHSIEDVISLETNFGAYTENFDTVDEFNLEIFGV